MFLFNILTAELNCQQPNAVDIGSTFIPPRRFCINSKVSQGLIYNNATSTAITTESVSNGTQLECRGMGGSLIEYNGWYKSPVFPIPTGGSLIRIGRQEVNKDGSGNVISYQPFTSYSASDTLFCITSDDKNYQIVRIQ
jgi:hypothetical protein